VTRTLWTIGLAAILLAGISTWLFTAEASGALPSGHYIAAPRAAWPATPTHADSVRRDALIRAAVRLPGPLRGTADPAEPLTCRYLAQEPSGTSAKFDCVLDGGEIVKVKYGRNSEIQAETAATRLLDRLGYAADEVRIVPRVRCYGCPRFPFFTTQLLTLARVPSLLSPYGHDNAYTDFEWPAVERRFDAPAVITPRTEGWAWFELKASQAPRADLDAFRLLAVFLAHWDNKSENQRLVCLDALPSGPDQKCAQPLLMIQDLGATFGPTKVNIAAWRNLPVWANRETCAVSMRPLPYKGATFPDATISEEGRAQLAQALSSMSRDEIAALFRDAHFPEFQSPTDDRRDLDAWGSAFRHRVDQIVTGGPCPE
jgi:hypothetical protein